MFPIYSPQQGQSTPPTAIQPQPREISRQGPSVSTTAPEIQKTIDFRQSVDITTSLFTPPELPSSAPTETSFEEILSQMSFDFGLPLAQEPVDWDQFLINADLQQQDPSDSPAPSESQAATPKSTESEQSQLLDVSAPDPDFDFEFNFGFEPAQSGITHRPEDIFNPLPPYTSSPVIPEQTMVADASIPAAFSDFGAFGDFTGLGDNAATQLGLTDLLTKLASATEAAPVPAAEEKSTLSQAYAALGWAPPTVEPASLSLSPQPNLKRKDSSSSADAGVPAKRPRGRPPKARSADAPSVPQPKRAYRRQSKGESSPLSQSVTFADEDADSEPDSPKFTASGKPSTARPKSVVPEKYLKDGTAQSILGMSIEEISNFPTFEDLLKKVEPSKQEAAAAFGARISENRDKAKDAAKKSREERKAKIDSLEKTVSDLEGKVEGLQSVLLALVARGVVSQAEVAAHLA